MVGWIYNYHAESASLCAAVISKEFLLKRKVVSKLVILQKGIDIGNENRLESHVCCSRGRAGAGISRCTRPGCDVLAELQCGNGKVEI